MNNLIAIIGIIVVCIFSYGLVEIIIIKNNGIHVPAPEVPRTPQVSGSGKKLTYVVMGDSTTIGQGADYSRSYTSLSADHLSKNYHVTFTNLGISGAKIQDVVDSQLAKAVGLRPDLVLLGVGANDTTHFTNSERIRASLQTIIDDLRQANPDVRIVATRSPALDSVSRFPIISKYILRLQTARVNQIFDEVIREKNIIPALIAEKTRDAFLADPTLTAEDNFHPNDRGYSLWVPIINAALDDSLR